MLCRVGYTLIVNCQKSHLTINAYLPWNYLFIWHLVSTAATVDMGMRLIWLGHWFPGVAYIMNCFLGMVFHTAEHRSCKLFMVNNSITNLQTLQSVVILHPCQSALCVMLWHEVSPPPFSSPWSSVITCFIALYCCFFLSHMVTFELFSFCNGYTVFFFLFLLIAYC